MGAVLLNAALKAQLAFIRERGTLLPTPFDGATADIELLAPLDDAIVRADIVVLGELNHFVHEKSDFRLFLARYLVSRGWTNFAEELGWSDGVRVNRFLATGDGAALERLPSFGSTSHLRADRDDRPTGILSSGAALYPRDLFRAEQARFYSGLREAARGERLQHFGFDIDGLPGGTYEDIAEQLSPFGSQPEVKNFLAALARVPGESTTAEASRIRASIGQAASLAQTIGAETARDMTAGLRALADSLNYVAMTGAAESFEALRPGMAYREDAMKRRMADIFDLCDGEGVVLMAHAFHLAKDDRALALSSEAVGPGAGLTPSLGHHLAQERGKRVVSVWFLYGGGEDSQPFPQLARHARYPRDSLNAALALLGGCLFHPASAPEGIFTQASNIGHMYNAIVPVRLGAQCDAVFFLPEVTPLRGA